MHPLLFGWFLVLDVFALGTFYPPANIGGNVQIYGAAALEWLAGGDPWARTFPTTFGPEWMIGPPTTLAPYAITSWLPMWMAISVWIGADLIASAFVVRRLGLPWTWMLFPPLAIGTFFGSNDPIVAALLLAGFGWAASVLKLTAVPPLIGMRAWRQLGVGAVLTAASFVVLPWPLFLRHLDEFPARALSQSGNGTSAASFPVLAAVTALALAALGWKRGWHLFVPALWPANQTSYATVSMRVLADMPLVAAAIAVPFLDYAGPLAIIAVAFASAPFQREAWLGRQRLRLILRPPKHRAADVAADPPARSE